MPIRRPSSEERRTSSTPHWTTIYSWRPWLINGDLKGPSSSFLRRANTISTATENAGSGFIPVKPRPMRESAPLAGNRSPLAFFTAFTPFRIGTPPKYRRPSTASSPYPRSSQKSWDVVPRPKGSSPFMKRFLKLLVRNCISSWRPP